MREDERKRGKEAGGEDVGNERRLVEGEGWGWVGEGDDVAFEEGGWRGLEMGDGEWE